VKSFPDLMDACTEVYNSTDLLLLFLETHVDLNLFRHSHWKTMEFGQLTIATPIQGVDSNPRGQH